MFQLLFEKSVFNSGKRPERLRVLCNQINSKVDTSLRTESLIHKEGKFTSKEEYKLLKALKKRLTAEGGSFVAMSRKFRSMDLDGNGVIDFEEFGLGISEYNIFSVLHSIFVVVFSLCSLSILF